LLLAAVAALLGILYLGSRWYGSRDAGQESGDTAGEEAGLGEDGGGTDENPNMCYD
jgi:hypothetical protein